MRQKSVEAKQEIVYKSDNLLKQVPACSHSEKVYNASYYSFCTTCCIYSAQIALQLSQVHSHTNFLFEYDFP